MNLEDDHYCFVCGEENPSGLHLKFSANKGKIQTEFIPRKIHQGYKNIVHGGIISTLLDEAMVKAALMQEHACGYGGNHRSVQDPAYGGREGNCRSGDKQDE